MTFDPTNWPIDCVSRCGSNEYVQDVANPNWRSVKARLEALETSDRPFSQEDKMWYVDYINGSDTNPGTQAQPWKNLQKALDELQKYVWIHNVNIQVRGPQTLPWDYATFIRVEKGKTVIIDGGSGVTVIVPAALADISGQINGNWRRIGALGAGLTTNLYKGKMLKLGNLGGAPGPLTGEKSTIIGNTADTYTVAMPFSGDPTGYYFEVVMPETTITVNDGLNYFNPAFINGQIFGGIWSFDGYGNCALQRFTFNGNIPVTIINKTKTVFHLASCCIDKPQNAFTNAWRLTFLFCNGTEHGCVATVKDPDVLGGGTILPLDKCGVGSVGGDASQFLGFWDILNEWNSGFFRFYGSFFNKVTLNASTGENPTVRFYSHIDLYEQYNSVSDLYTDHNNCSFGGYIPIGGSPNTFPGIKDISGCVTLGANVDISNSYHGAYSRTGKIRLEGDNITGTNNAVFGVCIIDTAQLYYERATQVNVTLGGAGGEVSLDGLAAIPGGHAGVLAPAPSGTPVRDIITGCVARIQPRTGF